MSPLWDGTLFYVSRRNDCTLGKVSPKDVTTLSSDPLVSVEVKTKYPKIFTF